MNISDFITWGVDTPRTLVDEQKYNEGDYLYASILNTILYQTSVITDSVSEWLLDGIDSSTGTVYTKAEIIDGLKTGLSDQFAISGSFGTGNPEEDDILQINLIVSNESPHTVNINVPFLSERGYVLQSHIEHTSVNSGTYGETTNRTLEAGDTFKVLNETVSDAGTLTGATEKLMTLKSGFGSAAWSWLNITSASSTINISMGNTYEMFVKWSDTEVIPLGLITFNQISMEPTEWDKLFFINNTFYSIRFNNDGTVALYPITFTSSGPTLGTRITLGFAIYYRRIK